LATNISTVPTIIDGMLRIGEERVLEREEAPDFLAWSWPEWSSSHFTSGYAGVPVLYAFVLVATWAVNAASVSKQFWW
jgi:hypothetical protein